MASLENQVKQDDSSSDGEDVSEKAKLVSDSGSIKKGNSGNSITFTADVVVHRSPKKVQAKPSGNGAVLTGTELVGNKQLREAMEECLEESETAKLLGSKEKLTNAAGAKEVPIVKETKRKLIKVDQEGGKTEIIIERSEKVVHDSIIHHVVDVAGVHTNFKKSEIKSITTDGEAGGDSFTKKEMQEKSSIPDADVQDTKKGDGDGDQLLPRVDIIAEAEEVGSEVTPSDAATDSCEQDTDTYDFYQTVGSMTPNSLSTADVFRSMAGTVASSQATFISADDTLGPTEDPPATPRLPTDTTSVQPESSVDLLSAEVELGGSTPHVDTETGEGGSLQEAPHASPEYTEDEDTLNRTTFEG